MQTDVKICGLSTAETMDAALDAGAAYVGLVFYPPSPRHLTPDAAKALAARAVGRAEIVALFVDPDDAEIDTVVQAIAPDYIQLHGEEPPSRAAELRNRTGTKIIKAAKVATADDIADAGRYAGCADILLFDAKAPPTASADKSLPGGNGETFDWSLLESRPADMDWMLSGGLNATNVAEAIASTAAPMIDVSSGVERGRGIKDVAAIEKFMAAVRHADKAGDKIISSTQMTGAAADVEA
ncbi:MAG: phosphoribosylanthranilate isomerase [Pseudomonadota bacterium]